jgi:PIN domain nuclease of toxin-antitoxin system
MKLLIDTHLLLWAAADTLPHDAVPYFLNDENELFFSPASIWEIIIKKNFNRPDFRIDAFALYQGLLHNGYTELNITNRHVLLIAGLPPVHKDPFDRILVAQAKAEEAVLLTSDKIVSNYSPAIYVGK